MSEQRPQPGRPRLPAATAEPDAIAVVTVLVGQPSRIRIRYALPGARWSEHVHAGPEPALAELSAWCETAFRHGAGSACEPP